MATNPLVGSWRLVSFESHGPDGSVTLTTPTTPFGGATSFRTLVWERV